MGEEAPPDAPPPHCPSRRCRGLLPHRRWRWEEIRSGARGGGGRRAGWGWEEILGLEETGYVMLYFKGDRSIFLSKCRVIDAKTPQGPLDPE